MKASDWLKHSTGTLEQASIATARLDALVLLEDVTHKDKSYLLAHPEMTLTATHLNKLAAQIKRRAGHEPLAYIRGKAEFYGREFLVTPDTLQPRPETETMVTLALEGMGDRVKGVEKPVRFIDVGTGSGCIGITLKLERPNAEVLATEINAVALKIAKQNAKKLHADVTFYQGDLLQPIPTLAPTPYTLLCNLPYVPDAHTINQAAMQEPKVAIFGGPDGLDIYRKLFGQIKELVQKPAYVFTESLPFQHAQLTKVAGSAGYALQKTDDFIQLFKRV